MPDAPVDGHRGIAIDIDQDGVATAVIADLELLEVSGPLRETVFVGLEQRDIDVGECLRPVEYVTGTEGAVNVVLTLRICWKMSLMVATSSSGSSDSAIALLVPPARA